ncbi:MAG: hypothetical protein ABIR37_00930 [Candidatus Saccharimonadales bacterium]
MTDKQVIKRFNELVHTKLHEAEQLPDAVQGWHCSGGHDTASFVLDAGPLAVKVAHDSDGHHRMSFAGFKGEDRLPAYELYVKKDEGLVVEFGGDKAEAPTMSEMLAQVAPMPVTLNERVPYGWVENDTITMVMFCGDFDLFELSGTEVNIFGLDAFVLQDQQLPAQLKMELDRHTEWIAAVWEQINAGRLVRLSDRINSLEGKAFARSDGTDMGYIEFDGTDGQTPAFVVGKPYVHWHPRENFPGELMQRWDDEEGQKPYKRHLAGWFS